MNQGLEKCMPLMKVLVSVLSNGNLQGLIFARAFCVLRNLLHVSADLIILLSLGAGDLHAEPPPSTLP